MPEVKATARFCLRDEVVSRVGYRFVVTEFAPLMRYRVRNASGETFLVNEYDLDLPPKPLPDDHLDRYMIEHAIIRRNVNHATYLVLAGNRLKHFTAVDVVRDREWFNRPHLLHGWSFHPDSPIQTPLEPGQ